MAVRIISAVVAIPLLLFFVIIGGLPLRCAVTVISLIGMYELYKAVSGKIKTVHIVGFAMETAYSVLMWGFVEGTDVILNMQWIIFSAGMLAVLAVLVFDHTKTNINDGAITVFGFIYLGILLNPICDIRDYNYNMVWLPFIYAFGCDTGAYFIGSKFGRHRLCPELSPKKSVEGAIGGVAAAFVITAIYILVYNKLFIGFSIKAEIIILVGSAAGAVLSQIGDLAASSIKRYVGIKDYGKIMPGHGGVLDRFDSVLFTIPAVYLLTLIV